jgi:hypothetical protein
LIEVEEDMVSLEEVYAKEKRIDGVWKDIHPLGECRIKHVESNLNHGSGLEFGSISSLK